MANRSRGRRADYDWIHVCGSGQIDLAVGAALLGTGSFDVLAASTVMRMHGLVSVELDAAAVNERILVAYGAIKVSDDAIAAGVASVPKPNTDGGAEWIVHGHLFVSSGQQGAVVNEFLVDRDRFDSKAMRKVKSSDSIAFVFEVCESSDQGGTADIQYGARLLQAS